MRENLIVISPTDQNATAVLAEALTKCRNGCKNIIRFQKGCYRFYREGTYHGVFFPSNNMSGEKDVVFPLLGQKNLIVDGDGSEFIFQNRIFPFIIQNSENITLKNFTVDFSFLRHFEGFIARSDEMGFELKVDRSRFTFSASNGQISFKTGEDFITTADRKLFIRGMVDNLPGTYIFVGDCTASKEKLAAPFMETEVAETDTGLYFKFRKSSFKRIYPIGTHIFIGNDENRENDVIFAEMSRNIRISDVTIKRGAGMGLIAQACENIDIERLTVAPSSARGDLLSVTADAIHCVNCNGRVTLKSCRFERSIDDAINIHGVYGIVKSADGNRVSVELGHLEQQGLLPYCIGDKLWFSPRDNMDEVLVARVLSVECDQNRQGITLTVEGDLPHKDDIIENPDRMPKILIDNCDFSDCPRNIFASSKKTVIKNCRFSMSNVDIYLGGDLSYWYESGPIGEMIVENCVFSDTAKGGSVKTGTAAGTNNLRRHRCLKLKNCSFAHERNRALFVDAVKQVEISDCTFDCRSVKQ